MIPRLLLGLLLLAPPALAQDPPADGLRMQGPVPTLRLADGDFTLRPTARLDADAGSFFGQEEPGGYRSGVNLRRARLGVSGTAWRDVTFAVTWEFGGQNPNDYSNFYEAQLAYTGFEGVALRVGAFTPQHLPDYAGSSFDLPFLERSAIANVAASLASGDSRLAAGAETNGALGGGGARYNTSFYVTAGVGSAPHDEGQRGLIGRAVVLAVDRPGLQLQLGGDGAVQFHPGAGAGPESVRLDDYPELRVDGRRFLDSGAIPAGKAWATGPEAAARIGPILVEGLWQTVGVDADAGPARRYEGWSVSALVPLLGEPRQRVRDTGTWRRPSGDGPLGAVELGLRYSTVDLRDGSRGARQDIWTAGVNWYPTGRLRLAAQYENGRTALPGGADRDFQAIGLRASFNL